MRFCITFVAAALVVVGAASNLRAETIRTVTGFDGKTTRVVEVAPIDPEAHLGKVLDSLPAGNQAVVRTLLEYPRDGTHRYWWPKRGQGSYDGVTTDVVVGGQTVLRGEPQGRTFCCGLTLEVLYKALGPGGSLPEAVRGENATDFKGLWFCREIGSPGPTDALLSANLGESIAERDKVLPGDFCQIWRHDRSGHSVVFVDWARSPAGEIVGIHYWSTQIATKGINFSSELYGDTGKLMDTKQTAFVRLKLPSATGKP